MWDNAGRLISTTAGGKTVGYQYDAAGNRIRTTWPEATPFYVTATFDALNRPVSLREMGITSLASYAYDDLSRRSTVTLENGTATTYAYSTTQGTLASLAHNLAGTAQDQAYSYTRNQVRDIVQHNWNNDLYQWAGATNGTKAYASNGLNQYTTVGASALSYDGNGNLAGDGYWAYDFDLNNRLKTATSPGYSATLTYDAEGRLRQTNLGGSITNLVYDGVALIGEYDASGNLLRRYVHGPGIDEPLVGYEGTGTTSKSWLYADHQGSIVGQANSSGASTAIYSYGPYGEPNVTTGSRFRYTGQQYLSGLGLYYYKARFYAPMLGRFLQTDPIGYSDNMNLYAYVGGNPANRSDQTGMDALVSWVGNNVNMNFRYFFTGEGATYNNVDCFANGITSELNGKTFSTPAPYRSKGDYQTYNTAATVTAVVTQDPFQIRALAAEGYSIIHISPMFGGELVDGRRPYIGGRLGSNNGEWCSCSSGWEAAHESMHVANLPDYYSYTDGSPFPSYNGNIMGAYGKLADARNFGEMLGRAGGGGSGFDVQMKGELAGGRSFSPSPKGK